MTSNVKTVRVELANRSYDILIGNGLLDRADHCIDRKSVV